MRFTLRAKRGRALGCRVGILLAFAAATVAGCDSDSDESGALPPDATAQVGDTVITKRQAAALLPNSMQKAATAQRFGTGYLIAIDWVKREAKREGLAATLSPASSGQQSIAQATGLFHELLAKTNGPPVSQQQVARFYREHPNRFRSPEVRYVRKISTASPALATTARRELERGKSWSAVIDRYTDVTTHIPPTKQDVGVTPYGEQPAMDRAIFAARRGTFVGPVVRGERWWVFELVRIRKIPGKSLDEVRAVIAAKLEDERVRRGRRILVERLTTRYRPMTVCGDRVRLSNCRNGPANLPVFLPFS